MSTAKLLKIAKRELNDRKVWEDAVEVLTDIHSLENSIRELLVEEPKVKERVSFLKEERRLLEADIIVAKEAAPKIIEAADIEAKEGKKLIQDGAVKAAKVKIAAADKKAAKIMNDAEKTAAKFFKEILEARDECKEALTAADEAKKKLDKINKELKSSKLKLRKLLSEE